MELSSFVVDPFQASEAFQDPYPAEEVPYLAVEDPYPAEEVPSLVLAASPDHSVGAFQAGEAQDLCVEAFLA